MWPVLFVAAMLVGALSGGGAMLAAPAFLAGGASHADAVFRSLVLVASASSVAAIAHVGRGNVDVVRALRFATVAAGAAFLVGTISGGWPVALGATVFGAVGVLAGLDVVRGDRTQRFTSAHTELATAAAVGALSGWVGAGGGFLLVPVLARSLGLSRALGTSAVVLTVQATAGALAHAPHVSVSAPLVAADVATGVAGAALGLSAAKWLPFTRARAAVGVLTAVLGLVVASSAGAPGVLVALAVGAAPAIFRFLVRPPTSPSGIDPDGAQPRSDP